jgi:hypothetical protein
MDLNCSYCSETCFFHSTVCLREPSTWVHINGSQSLNWLWTGCTTVYLAHSLSKDRNAFFYKCCSFRRACEFFSFQNIRLLFMLMEEPTSHWQHKYLATPSLVTKFSRFPSGAWRPWELALIHCQVSVYRKVVSRATGEWQSCGFDFSAGSWHRQPAWHSAETVQLWSLGDLDSSPSLSEQGYLLLWASICPSLKWNL